MYPVQPPADFDADLDDDSWLKRLREAVGEPSATQSFAGTAANAVSTDHHDERVGPYLLDRRLGAGGMGVVWLAHRADGHFYQTVAVKLIKRGMDTDEIIKRFRLERQVLATLNHPNIARMFDGGATDDGRPFLVMEYIDGKPLLESCDRRDLDVDARLDLFRRICLAVHHAHTNLVMHRDLKPGNILVNGAGEPMLLDFGIAKILDDEHSFTTLTRTDSRALTPRYASPEQIRGERLTTATDIYSLGVILYELLTGRTPYRLDLGTRREFELAVLEQQPPLPSTAVRSRDDLPAAARTKLSNRLRGDLDTIVLKALAKTPHERYASAEQLAQDIERHAAGLPLLARRPTSFARLYRMIRRRRGGLAAASVGAVLMLALATVFIAYTFLRPAWIEERVNAARSQLISQRGNNQFYNLSFWNVGPAERFSDPDKQWHNELAPVLEAYQGAIRLGADDKKLRFEYETVLLAYGIDEMDAAATESVQRLKERIPLTIAMAQHWSPQTLEAAYSPSDLTKASLLDLRCLGLFAMLRRDYDTAINAWSRLSLIEPDPLVEALLGNLYLALNRPQLAYARLLSAYRLAPDDPDLGNYLADAAARCGDVGPALHLLESAEASQGVDTFGVADRVRMLCLIQQNRTQEALDFYLHSNLPRDNAIAQMQMATHLEQVGDWKTSLEVLSARGDDSQDAYALHRKTYDLTAAWWLRLSEQQRRAYAESLEDPDRLDAFFPTTLRHFLWTQEQLRVHHETVHPIAEQAGWWRLLDPPNEADLKQAQRELSDLARKLPRNK